MKGLWTILDLSSHFNIVIWVKWYYFEIATALNDSAHLFRWKGHLTFYSWEKNRIVELHHLTREKMRSKTPASLGRVHASRGKMGFEVKGLLPLHHRGLPSVSPRWWFISSLIFHLQMTGRRLNKNLPKWSGPNAWDQQENGSLQVWLS